MAATARQPDEAWTAEEQPKEVLNVAEAAAFLRIGRNQLYEAVGRGEVPCQRIGRVIRFSRTALIAWLGRGQ